MIEIAVQLCNEIASHGERDYPHECCGLLLGIFAADGSKSVSETYAISNAREEAAKRNRFLITPEELLQGERYAANRHVEIVGFYHSHPDHPAVPSQYDQDHALPVYSYVVVSVRQALRQHLRSWTLRLDRTQFDEEVLLKGKENHVS